MSKPPSDATKLRSAIRELRSIYTQLSSAHVELDAFRVRARRAEQEVAEWKARFDALLARTPMRINDD